MCGCNKAAQVVDTSTAQAMADGFTDEAARSAELEEQAMQLQASAGNAMANAGMVPAEA